MSKPAKAKRFLCYCPGCKKYYEWEKIAISYLYAIQETIKYRICPLDHKFTQNGLIK